jgi:V/A-type H+-transporting ATPase subunit E
MSLEKILEKILEEAQVEADKIIQENLQKAEEIKQNARKQGEEQARALLEEAERQAQLDASRIITQAHLEKKIEVLSCKKDLIEEILDKVFRKLDLKGKRLKRTIVMKEGEKEETLDLEELKQQLRPNLEKEIAEVLKI